MSLIHVDKIQPGMRLAADVRDQNGRVLLAAGHELTERHVRIFRMWGVTEAEIKRDDRDDALVPATHPDPAAENLEDQAEFRFRHSDLNHPAVKELYRLYTERMVDPPPAGADHAN